MTDDKIIELINDKIDAMAVDLCDWLQTREPSGASKAATFGILASVLYRALHKHTLISVAMGAEIPMALVFHEEMFKATMKDIEAGFETKEFQQIQTLVKKLGLK